jgi:hypothetical protein
MSDEKVADVAQEEKRQLTVYDCLTTSALDPYIRFTVDHNTPDVGHLSSVCKGELMPHQSKVVWALSELENMDTIEFYQSEYASSNIIATNRYKLTLPQGTGKTRTAIGLIIKSPVPRMRPIYFRSGTIMQERRFSQSAMIRPTIIVMRSSVYGQWLDEIREFSTLRVYEVHDTRTLTSLTKMVASQLTKLNETIDVILINYKTVTGNLDGPLSTCADVYSANKQRSKNMHTVLMNVFSRKCLARIIYDDPEFYMKASPFENALSCIYMSATHKYGSTAVHYTVGEQTLECLLEYPQYTFSQPIFAQMVEVTAEASFLNESISMGLQDYVPPVRAPEDEEAAVVHMPKSMMPAEPEVYICTVESKESKTIDIIATLCDDVKIMESVNSLTVTSFGEVIKTLMAERYEVYKNALDIISHYEHMDIKALSELPKPPEGTSFTKDNLLRRDPIEYSYRDLGNRIAEVIKDARKMVDTELKVMDRVKSHLSDEDCCICLEELKLSPAAIMTCCNSIIHLKCALNCPARRCHICRTAYKARGEETFAVMHHDTDFSAFAGATSTKDVLNALEVKVASDTPVEMTKLSILNDILGYKFSSLPMLRVKLNKFDSLVYDSTIEAKCEADSQKIKALIYCSADETLANIEASLTIDHARLSASSKKTYERIKHFRSTDKPTALLANAWRDAAGIDFKTATDVIIINYVEQPAIVQQMMARVLRMGRVSRPRIWLISYSNERERWLSSFVTRFEAPAT